MLRIVSVAAGLITVVALTASAADAHRQFIDYTREELVQAVPELAAVQFESNQDNLDRLLGVAGENLTKMFTKLVDISAAEQINELRFDQDMGGKSRRESFRYVIRLLPGSGSERFDEFRIDPDTNAPFDTTAPNDFLLLSHFVELLNYLLPQYQVQSRFRYIGRWHDDGQDSFVVVFAQHPDSTEPRSHIHVGPDNQTARMQGLAWIDAETNQLVRLRLDVLGPIERFPLETVTTEVSLNPVTFKSIESALWLPDRVTVHASFAGGELHSVHRYSDYEAAVGKGMSLVGPSGEDAYELIARAITLVRDRKPGDAILPLREAIRIRPEIPSAHFNLANALFATGDVATAEAELRQAVKLVPESAVVHNSLGLALAKRGDIAGAVTEFRKTTQIRPKDSTVHFNLGQALDRLGDQTAALIEYRTASELAPSNTAFKTRYEQFEQAAKAPPLSEANIKVDVRQVLVPVIVTDKEGHHITGLTQSDFRAFEDGVEQKLSAFSVEDATLNVSSARADTGTTSVPAGGRTLQSPASQKSEPARRTYVICIDSLHSAAANLISLRKELSKLFRSERLGDSQFLMLAIGTSTQLVQDTTSDPDRVLRAIEGKDFQKIYLASRKSDAESDLRAFRRALDEVRAACDSHDASCSQKMSLLARANGIASEEQAHNVSFLSQVHSLVQQLSRVPGRRTMILISDGFQLVPGKQARDLLVAYFPEFKSVSLQTLDRMPELDAALHLAANNNIAIYTIDSRGLYTSPFFEASNSGSSSRLMPAVLTIMNAAASESGDTLSEIAAATGGTAFQNSNNVLMGLQRAFADGRQYYLLAYVPTNSNPDGTFRAISVRLRDSKMVVKAKRGYWAVAN